MDAYSATLVVLENLYDKVVPGGFIIFDDSGLYETVAAKASCEATSGPGFKVSSFVARPPMSMMAVAPPIENPAIPTLLWSAYLLTGSAKNLIKDDMHVPGSPPTVRLRLAIHYIPVFDSNNDESLANKPLN